MIEDLKPVRCGCGGEAVKVQHELFDRVFKWRIHCMKCGIETRMYNTEAEAITAWNRAMSGNVQKCAEMCRNVQKCAEDACCSERTTKPECWNGYSEKGWYKCACGKGVYQGQNYCSGCGARLEWE